MYLIPKEFGLINKKLMDYHLESSITKENLWIDIFNEDYVFYNPKETELYANLDKTQLIRIVTNLIKNATQAVEKVDNPKIDVKVSCDKDKIFIEVSDNGKGIQKEVEQLIFEPKFTTKTSGMGLGLAMVKNIVEAYNGSITFVSKVNEKTTFSILPLNGKTPLPR